MSDHEPRVMHVSPFVNVAGGITAMLTLLAEQAKRRPTYLFTFVEGYQTVEARKLGVTALTAFGDGPFPSGRWYKFIKTVDALKKGIVANQIDLIHSHSAIGNHYCWPAKLLTGKPLVTHQRDNYARNYFHFGLGAADRIIAVSEWIKRTLPPRLAKKTTAILDAVELPDFTPPEREPARPLRVGIGGRCTPDKGHDLLVEAAIPLVAKIPFEVEVWGWEDNAYGKSLKGRVEAAGPEVAARFRFEGFRHDMDNFYARMDVVVVPSRFAEPLGRMMSEAMARYRPVIVAAHGGMIEVVEDGVSGLHFKPGDAADLRRQLERLLTDPALRERFGRAGRPVVEAKLDPQAYRDAVDAVYRMALGQNA